MCSQLIQIDIDQNQYQHAPYHLVNIISTHLKTTAFICKCSVNIAESERDYTDQELEDPVENAGSDENKKTKMHNIAFKLAFYLRLA